MKLILNLLLLFIVFAVVRRTIRRFLAPSDRERTPPEPPKAEGHPRDAQGSRSHPAIDEAQIEDAEFEELD